MNNQQLEYFSSFRHQAILLLIVGCLSSFPIMVLGQQTGDWGRIANLRELNTEYDDFAPQWSPDRLLYYNSMVRGYSMFFTGQREDLTHFSGPRQIPGNLNKPRNNQSFITFGPDGTIYFSTYHPTEKRPWMNIFQIVREDSIWSMPGLVEGINEDTFTSHPTLSPSGTTLVFTSDRPGGKGGTDLWITRKKQNGLWESPVNMGEALNSAENEITPFLASEDSLYFSSNGFGGKGGYEVFLTTRYEGVWQAPLPLPDINTEYDESDFVVIPNNTAVFASNRIGGKGGLDLYAVFPVPRAGPTPPALEYVVTTPTPLLTIEEFSAQESFPLLTYLFFSRNSAEPSSGIHLLSPEEARSFMIAGIQPNSLAVYSEILNILGRRLQEFTDATLKITGCTDESTAEEHGALGRRRAEAIQHYLHTVWNIDNNRIQIVGRDLPAIPSNPQLPEGSEENRRVELQSNDARLFEPVRLGDISTIVTPPQIEVTVDARPRVLVQKWELTLSTDDSRRPLIESGTSLPHRIIFATDAFAASQTADHVQMQLSGIDSLGRIGSSELRIPLQYISVQQKQQKRMQDKFVERYSLLIFDFNQAKLNEDHKRLVREIAKTVTPQSTITVSGYTDTIGEETYNAQLAEQRATAVADELRQYVQDAHVVVQAFGESNLFDNATPYGRFYSRTVQITIEKIQK